MLRRIVTRLRSRIVQRGLARDTAGVSGIEFALILPVMVLMLGGAVELSGAITAGNRATYVADAIGQVVSQAKEPITQAEMAAFIKSAALVNPDLLDYAAKTGKDLEDAAFVNISSVQFSPSSPSCESNCTYDADVVFSTSLAGPERACGKLAASPTPGIGTLPPDVFSPGSLVVVDVETFYQPLMTTFLGDEISFKRSSYFRPRYISRVNSKSNCPGYPEN